MQARRWILVLGCVVAVVFLVTILVRMRHQRTLSEIGTAALEWIEEGDAGSLMGYVREKERLDGNLSEDALKALLERVVRPAMRGFQRDGMPSVERTMDGELVSCEYRHPDGRWLVLTLSVVDTEDGPQFESLAFDLVTAALRANWPADPRSRPPAVSGPSAYAQVAPQLLPILKALPIRGLLVRLPSGVKFQTWEEHVEYWRHLSALTEQGSSS